MNPTEYTPAQQAIGRSVAETRIVHLSHTAEVAADLTLECDDFVEDASSQAERVDEYWGTTEDGHTWRVHLHGEG